MHTRPSLLRRGLLAMLIAATLSACGAAPAPVSSSPSPSAAPAPAASDAPDPSVAPSPAASAAPATSDTPSQATNVLPQPLLFLRDGQIVRMERDGKTITPITAEQPGQPDILAIFEFDVSPVDGSLIYAVQGSTGNTIVRTDANGKQRTVLLPNVAATHLRYSPDGTQIALRISAPLEATGGQRGGVYVIPAAGGVPQLLQADDNPNNSTLEGRGYMPHRWSPDGNRLLVSAYGLALEVCSAAVIDMRSRGLVPIQSPQGTVSGCASGQWSADGQRIFIQMSGPGPQPPVPGLWQADPATGALTPYIQGQNADGTYALTSNQRPLDDGTIYVFIADVETPPDPFSGIMPRYRLYKRGTADGTAVRSEQFAVVGQALWADDNSGVLVDMISEAVNDVVTAWIPIDGGPVIELGRFMGEEKHWTR